MAKRRQRWRVVNQFWKWIARKRVQTALVGRRRLGPGKSSSLTRGRRKRFWRLAPAPSFCSGAAWGATGGVRDHSRGSAREENPRTGRGSSRTSDAPAFERMQARNTVPRGVEAVPAPSSAGQPGPASSQDGAASHGRSVRFTPSAKHLAAAWRKPRARKSSDPRVLVSLVGCRSRGEASCSSATRGAARQTERRRDSTGRHPSPSTGAGHSMRSAKADDRVALEPGERVR